MIIIFKFHEIDADLCLFASSESDDPIQKTIITVRVPTSSIYY